MTQLLECDIMWPDSWSDGTPLYLWARPIRMKILKRAENLYVLVTSVSLVPGTRWCSIHIC